MGCGRSLGGCGVGPLSREKENKPRVVKNYYINDDHSVDIKDSVVHRSTVGSTLRVCPYCGRKLDFPEEPNFCPYCERRLK